MKDYSVSTIDGRTFVEEYQLAMAGAPSETIAVFDRDEIATLFTQGLIDPSRPDESLVDYCLSEGLSEVMAK